jgi:hypothetical protein
MSGWCTLTARRTGDGPSAEEAVAAIEPATDYEVGAHDANGTLFVTIRGREAAPLKEFVEEHPEAFDLIAIGTANDTGPGVGSATFYEVTDTGLDKQPSRSQRPPYKHNGLTASLEFY